MSLAVWFNGWQIGSSRILHKSAVDGRVSVMYFAIITLSHIFQVPFYKNVVVIYVFLLEEAMYSYCYLCILIVSLCRGELSYLAPLGSENISAPYFKQCFFRGGGVLPPQTVKHHASQSQDRNNKYFILYIEFCINNI